MQPRVLTMYLHAPASQQAPHAVHPASPATPISDEIRAAAHTPATHDNAATTAMVRIMYHLPTYLFPFTDVTKTQCYTPSSYLSKAPTGSIENVQEAPTEPTSATHGLCTEVPT